MKPTRHTMKTLTVIAPAYNEAESIRDFYNVLKSEISKLSGYTTDMIFVVDGGTDKTIDILRGIAADDPKLRVIRFSRNFGHQMAYLAGLDAADSDVIIMMDSDLQHPPAVIPQLLAAYEQGSDVVYTIRRSTKNLGVFRRIQSFLFYRFLNLISEIPIGENTSDFRLLSRRVAGVIRTGIRERTMFLRGIVSWVGFRQSAVEYDARERFAGKSKLPLPRLIQFGLSGIVSFSRKPLRAASAVGLLFALFGVCFAAVTIVQYYMGQIQQPGFATIVVLLSVFAGVQLMFLGVIGEYIGAIFDQVKLRPHYIIEEAINISPEKMEG